MIGAILYVLFYDAEKKQAYFRTFGFAAHFFIVRKFLLKMCVNTYETEV